MNDDPPDPLHLRNIAGWAMAVDFISIRASAINRDQRLGEEGNRYVILQSQGKNVSCDRSSDCTNRLIQTLPAVAAREDTGSAQSYQVRRGGAAFFA